MRLFSYAAILLLGGCTMSHSLSDALGRGGVIETPFEETIAFDYPNRLIIVPVTIRGETYRFLWDTGAPTGISTALAAKLSLPKVYEGTMHDSQGARTRVDYLAIDSLYLGEVLFTNQTAFVSRWDLHPIIRCLNLDGIIGGNTMRYANWTIDYQAQQLTLSSRPGPGPQPGDWVASFTVDSDYDMIIDLGVGGASATGLTFDTGSTSGISIPDHLFQKWTGLTKPDSIYVDRGYQQSGLYGKAVEAEERYTRVDSVTFGDFLARQVWVSSGHSALVGNELWSQFRLTIDWERRKVYGQPVTTPLPTKTTYGFALSWDTDQQHAYVLWVQRGSMAESLGISPGDKATQVGDIVLRTPDDYCAYIETYSWQRDQHPEMPLVLQDSAGQSTHLVLPRVSMGVENGN